MAKEMTGKEIRKQADIIQKWADEAAFAYNMNVDDITDGHIVSYLAQVQLGLHKLDEPKN